MNYYKLYLIFQKEYHLLIQGKKSLNQKFLLLIKDYEDLMNHILSNTVLQLVSKNANNKKINKVKLPPDKNTSSFFIMISEVIITTKQTPIIIKENN